MGSANDKLGTNFGQPGAPGFLPPAATAQLGPSLGRSVQDIMNMYNKLGMGGPGQAGGVQTAMGTPEQMDVGLAPSVSGGIPGQFAAIQGQLQDQVVGGTPLGSNTSPASIVSNIGGLLGNLTKSA